MLRRSALRRHHHVRAWSTDNPGLMLLDKTTALARWLSVTDPTGQTDRALFLKTAADGPGKFVQQKKVDFFLPETGPTTFSRRRQRCTGSSRSFPAPAP